MEVRAFSRFDSTFIQPGSLGSAGPHCMTESRPPSQDPPPSHPGAEERAPEPEAAPPRATRFHTVRFQTVRFHAERFAEQVGWLERALDRLAADPLDEEAVHDARVACRRLRVGLRLVRGGLGRRRRVRRLGRRLSALRTALGAAREAEVGRVTLAEFRPRLRGDERLAADALAAFLDVRQGELRHAAAEQLARLDVAWIRRRLRRGVTRLERRAAAEARADEAVAAEASGPAGGAEPPEAPPLVLEPPAPTGSDLDPRQALGPRAVAAVERCRAAWLELPLDPLLAGEDDALHRCRIEGKKLRYTLEFYESVFGEPARTRLKLLREIQDRLGAIHDRADLGARLHELAAAARRLEDGRLVIGYEALARLVEDDRRALLAGFARQHAGVAHPAFVPPARPEFLAAALPAAPGPAAQPPVAAEEATTGEAASESPAFESPGRAGDGEAS